MEKRHYSFEEFASATLKMMEVFNDLPDELTDEVISQVDENLKNLYQEIENNREEGYEFPYIECGEELYRNALLANKEQLVKYLSLYYSECESYYDFYEYEYSGFGSGFMRFTMYNPIALYLCAKYFDSIGEKEKADKSYYFLNCYFSYQPFYPDSVEFISDNFERIKPFINADWETVNPNITFNIGTYYKDLEQYEKAMEWFELGADIDYEGRQSIEPFINVSKNQYELGLLYLNGLGVEVNDELAYEYFGKAAENCGQRYLPIMGDMILDGKIELYEDEDANELAVKAYADINEYNVHRAPSFVLLSEEQKERFNNLLIEFEKGEDYQTYNTYRFLEHIYESRLYDEEKANYYKQKQVEVIKKTPPERRDRKMAAIYSECVIEDYRNSHSEPTESTGSIPSSLKKGDKFIFGIFDNEPIEWKVLETYDDGSYCVISSKILIKLQYGTAKEWMNTDFYELSFSKEEKKHIVTHDYSGYGMSSETRCYLVDYRQIFEAEGTYEKGTIKETNLAKSICNEMKVMCDRSTLLPDGNRSMVNTQGEVCGIRPIMDIVIEPQEKRLNK